MDPGGTGFRSGAKRGAGISAILRKAILKILETLVNRYYY